MCFFFEIPPPQTRTELVVPLVSREANHKKWAPSQKDRPNFCPGLIWKAYLKLSGGANSVGRQAVVAFAKPSRLGPECRRTHQGPGEGGGAPGVEQLRGFSFSSYLLYKEGRQNAGFLGVPFSKKLAKGRANNHITCLSCPDHVLKLNPTH